MKFQKIKYKKMDNNLKSAFKEGNNSTLFDSINKNNLGEKIFPQKNQKDNLFYEFFKIANLIFPGFILTISPGLIVAYDYIELEVNKEGLNQYLSDQYSGPEPTYVYVDYIRTPSSDKKVNVSSINNKIKLEWRSDTLTDFNNMFSDLENIVSFQMRVDYGNHTQMTYMFKNCINLVTFISNTNNDKPRFIEDMKGMFYNCQSLTSSIFRDFYFDQRTKIDLSYMFYNCKNLESIDIFSNEFKYISNMKAMFYNCTSLTTIDLRKFKTDSKIDLSLAFYNCQNLQSIQFPSSFGISNMEQLFYNCQSLKQIDLRSFRPTSSYLDFSSLFFNCFN